MNIGAFIRGCLSPWLPTSFFKIVLRFYSCLLILFALIKPGMAQKITEPNWNPDTVRVRYFDDCCSKPFPPSVRFPYYGVTGRTFTETDGAYVDQMRDADSLRLLFTVRHRPASGRGEIV